MVSEFSPAARAARERPARRRALLLGAARGFLLPAGTVARPRRWPRVSAAPF